ncbi:MAG: PhzF family phenazine biosynthesis protein [Cytophagales bacterium]|nr:PhzF family phenazine biosynthesis protein [Bernardetiaceae bacterium]MDW8211574.1 PhzF family phenazine biosynthesis protein [Cytophagales bacterium]
MRKIPIYHVDAFSRHVFGGNPAAVCPLEEWLPDSLMQTIAAENNLSETAFFVPKGREFEIRWFTPQTEVNLCGHATLAAAYVILNELECPDNFVHFHSLSGLLKVYRKNDYLELDFPSMPPQPAEPLPELIAAMGIAPQRILRSRDYVCVYQTEEEVISLSPNWNALAKLDALGVIATAPGKECHFVSRFFAPKVGINEDPVTGSAHSTLIPYWAERLGKSKMLARQLSKRGGELFCELHGNRVRIGGYAALYLKGDINIP